MTIEWKTELVPMRCGAVQSGIGGAGLLTNLGIPCRGQLNRVPAAVLGNWSPGVPVHGKAALPDLEALAAKSIEPKRTKGGPSVEIFTEVIAPKPAKDAVIALR